MRPVLFHLFGVPVYAYSLSIVVGYIVCLAYGVWQAKKQGQDVVHVLDASITIFVGGFLGARLLAVIVDWRAFLDAPLEIFKIWNGGFVYFGGFIGGIGLTLAMIAWKKLDFWLWADLLAPSGIICLIFGRLGCFGNGCCYGRVSPDLPWGVVYPMSHTGLGLVQLPVHPAPLYESAACLLISLFLIWRLPRKRFPGEVFWLLWVLYSAARFIIEFFRGDPRGYLEALHLSTSQAVAVVTFTVGAVFLARGWTSASRRAKAAAGPRPPETDGPGRHSPPLEASHS